MKPTFGVTVMPLLPSREFVRLVGEVERLGFDHLWVADSSLHSRYCYSYLTLAAMHTKRLKLGPNCSNPHTRHPAMTLSAITTVDEISGGRMHITFGSGAEPVLELGFRPARVNVLRQTVEVCRRLLREETLDYAGDAWILRGAKLRYGTRRDIPIYITASGPKMLQLAGEVADGAIFQMGSDPACLKYVLENIEIGAGKAGRSLRDIDVAWCGSGSLDPDRKKAFDQSRTIAAWLIRFLPVYGEIAGFPADVVARVGAAYSAGHFNEAEAAGALVTDEMVDRLALAGTPEDFRRKIEGAIGLGIRHIEFEPTGPDTLAEITLFAEEVMPHFSR